MLKMKNAAISMAVVLALAACGGGGGGDAVDTGNNPPANPGGGNNNPPAQDAQFAQGNLALAAGEVFEGGRALPYTAFVDSTASGGLYGVTAGTNSPVQSFGLRVSQEGMAGQSNPVRIGIELDDMASDARMQVLLSGVQLSISDTGTISVAIPATATAHAEVRTATNTTTSANATGLPATAVRLVDIPGDTTSDGLVVDLQAIMGAVIAAAPEANRAALRAASEFSGRHTLRMAISGVTLNVNGTATTAGGPITVGTQPALNGGGVSGNIWLGGTAPAGAS